MAAELFGRDSEIAAVELLLAGIGDGGGLLLMLGDPGTGKSALAELASRHAAGRGMRVLTCSGVPGETHLSFAGLHQLLRPVPAEAGGLPRGQRDALLTALGVGEGAAPAMPLVGLAALELLAVGAGGGAGPGCRRGCALAGSFDVRGAGVRKPSAGRGPGGVGRYRPRGRAG